MTETLVPYGRRPRRATASRWGALAGFVAVLLVAAGCGNSQYRYVTNSHPNLQYLVNIPNRDPARLTVKAASTYLKLPTSWRVFSQDDWLLHVGVGTFPPDEQFDIAHKHLFTPFDGNVLATLDNVDSLDGSRPSGKEEIVVLDDQQRDSFSLSDLRNYTINYDQALFDAQSKGKASAVHIISENPELTKPGGYHGSEIVFGQTLPDGTSQTIDQIALIDSSTRVLYVLLIGCEAHCFTAYQSTIAAVVRSWTLK